MYIYTPICSEAPLYCAKYNASVYLCVRRYAYTTRRMISALLLHLHKYISLEKAVAAELCSRVANSLLCGMYKSDALCLRQNRKKIELAV